MHRIYSTDSDGISFSCLEYALLGYDGPNLLVVKTKKNEVIGAFAHGTWKDSIHYHGSTGCFLFQLQPRFKLLPATGEDGRFMYLHSGERAALLQPALQGLPHGIGFGGSTATKPRLFIPDTLEHCTAGFMDTTYQVGDVLPDEDLEQFEIACLEVWGVGDDIIIQHALKKREEYRVYHADCLKKAQTVEDKTQFVQDLASGLTPNNLYKHRDEARGRHDFAVDDKHGGYKIDRE
jgi:TLD